MCCTEHEKDEGRKNVLEPILFVIFHRTKKHKLVTLVIPVITSVSAAVPATYNIFQVAI
jgi:hypothetical protein